MKKRTKKMLLGAGVLSFGMVATTTVVHLITRKLVKMALKRDGVGELENSKVAKKRITGLKDVDGFFEALRRGEEKLRGYETETVEIESYDGTRLIGHFYPCKDAKRIIIAMHGWRSNWAKDFGTIADSWHNAGCSILFAEQRGQGESGGDYMGFGMMERYDCLEWAKWAEREKGKGLPIYLAGVSMGAATVLMASNLKLPVSVRGIIADCGFTSAHDIWKHVVKHNLHLSYGLMGRIANDMCRRYIQMGPKEISTTDALKECKVPVIFIHGAEDHFVPIEMTYENYKACAAPKRILVVPGADHGMCYHKCKEEYEKAIEAFWREFDK